MTLSYSIALLKPEHLELNQQELSILSSWQEKRKLIELLRSKQYFHKNFQGQYNRKRSDLIYHSGPFLKFFKHIFSIQVLQPLPKHFKILERKILSAYVLTFCIFSINPEWYELYELWKFSRSIMFHLYLNCLPSVCDANI